MLVYQVLPRVGPYIAVLLTTPVALVPAIFLLLFHAARCYKSCVYVMIDIVAMSMQATLFIWLWFYTSDKETITWTTVSLVFISFGFWEVFVNENQTSGVLGRLAAIKRDLNLCRYKTYLLLNVWKILVIFFFMVYAGITKFGLYRLAHPLENANGTYVYLLGEEVGVHAAVFWSVLLQMLSSLIGYYIAVFAIRSNMQMFGFSLPLIISELLAVVGIFTLPCLERGKSVHIFLEHLVDEVVSCDGLPEYIKYLIVEKFVWMFLLWYLSLAWITGHIWFKKSSRLHKTKRYVFNKVTNHNNARIDVICGFNCYVLFYKQSFFLYYTFKTNIFC